MYKKIIVHTFVLTIFFLKAFVSYSQAIEVSFGDSLELTGRIESREYKRPTGDKLVAFMMRIPTTLKILAFNSDEEYSLGREIYTDELHVDKNNLEMTPYQGKFVKVIGVLRPSENAHHLGRVCLKPSRIEIQ